MSTVFEVYPHESTIPSFCELLQRSTQELHQFLNSIGIADRPEISVRLLKCHTHDPVPFSVQDAMRWAPDTYAWFTTGEIPGGTDAYFDNDSKEITSIWSEPGYDEPKYTRLQPTLRECVAVGHRWRFRRSAGQFSITTLAYGLIAGSLAAITGGFIYSEDGAGDWDRLPALSDEFFAWYFKPELAIERDKGEWWLRCIRRLREDLNRK